MRNNTQIYSGDGTRARRYQESNGYEYVDGYDGGGAIFENTWLIPLDPLNEAYYHGILEGDSGGPLFETDYFGNYILCGVASRFFPWEDGICLPGGCTVEPVIMTDHAAINPRLEWVAEKILQDGWFHGECEFNPLDDNDTDGDQIPDSCDNCFEDPNGNQLNSDGDQYGDVCDPCPEHNNLLDSDCDGCPGVNGFVDPCPGDGNIPNPTTGDPADVSCGDYDKDGLCNSLDVCWATKNGDSYTINTNARAEQVYTPSEIWPDMCEPVPQPQADAAPPTVTVVQTNGFFQTEKLKWNVIELTPQPSRSKPSLDAYGDPAPVPGMHNTVPFTITTHFRFCQDTLNSGKCNVASAIAKSQLHLAELTENSTWPYHRVTMSTISSSIGATKNYVYNGLQTYNEVWDYVADFAKWSSGGQIGLPMPAPEYLGGPASGLGGAFWIYGQTTVGSPGTTNYGTGFHGANPVNGGQLPSRHFALDPEHVQSNSIFAFEPDVFFLVLTLPDPWNWRGRAQVNESLLVTKTKPSELGAAHNATSAQSVTSRIGPALNRSIFDAHIIWAPAVEPNPGTANEPVAVGIDQDGVSLVDVAQLSANATTLLGWGDGVPRNGATTSGLEPREGFLPVYSRYFKSVYLLSRGGGRIGRLSTSDQTWEEFATTPQMAAPIAATLSFRDGQLYVLDEVSTSSGTNARLVRYRLNGDGQVLGTWPRRYLYDRLWLQVRTDGNLLLVASDVSDVRHRVMGIRVDGSEPQATDEHEGLGFLPWPLVMDPTGYRLYPHVPQGWTPLNATRLKKLRGAATTWGRVGELL